MSGSIYSDGSYLKSNPGWHVEDSPWKAQQVLRMLQQHNINPRTVAEVGCGAGEIIRQLSLHLPAATFSGFDISTDAIALAQTRQNERIHFFNMDLRASPVSFDVLLVMDVVEHIEDCFGFLRSIREKAEYKIIHIPLDMSVSLLVRNRLMDVRKSVGTSIISANPPHLLYLKTRATRFSTGSTHLLTKSLPRTRCTALWQQFAPSR